MTRRFANLAWVAVAGVALTSAFADEKLAGIACRSVHLAYPGSEGSAFYNEVTVEASAVGTYFCACGFDQGYFGIQELGNGRKLAIFSVWDPGQQDDPDSVDPARRVKLVSKGEGVRVGRFGNEGTGGQSFLDLDWKPGATYRFLVTAKVEGDRTAFSAAIAAPGASAWRPIATFSTIARGKLLGGYYSFIEDFRRDKVSATVERRARFGGGYLRDKEGQWRPIERAKFTADRNPSTAIDAGTEGARFFLATGGKVENQHRKLGQTMELELVADRKEGLIWPSHIPELP